MGSDFYTILTAPLVPRSAISSPPIADTDLWHSFPIARLTLIGTECGATELGTVLIVAPFSTPKTLD
jgi:hypothetical protein